MLTYNTLMRMDTDKPIHPKYLPGEGYERENADSTDSFVTSGMPIRPELFRTATQYAMTQIDMRQGVTPLPVADEQ